MKRNLPLLIIGSVLVLAVIAGGIMYRSAKPAQPQQQPSPQPTRNMDTAVAGADPPRVRGVDSAPVTLEEFGDFECPPCGLLHPELKAIEKQYGDHLRVVFRHFPLAQIHKYAYDAARAAEAAGLQGKFWEMHDLLYDKQNEWNVSADARAVFSGYAKSLGLDVARFERDMVGELASARVALDMRRGRSLGVTGTPTVFINGRQLTADEMTRDGIRHFIDKALREKGQ